MLNLFTIIWGEEMIESYLEVTLPSLMQPNNIPRARELLHSYNFYASDEARERVSQNPLLAKLTEVVEVNWFPLEKGEWETTSNTLHQMKISAAEGHYMLIMAPDSAVGNGSILNIARLCDGTRNPVLFGFPRVNEEGWQVIQSLFKQGQVVSNRKLVTIGMRYIEQTTYPIEPNIIHWIVQGNSWRVRHNVPTPCILPDRWIIEIFSTNPTLNSGYDHTLPYLMIQRGYPWHLIRHSDEFFLVERGRHLIIEGSGYDSSTWHQLEALKSLEFFGKEEVIWQGI